MPNFIMLVGLPGAGKTYTAQQLAKGRNAVVLSSDNIRKELYGSEVTQGTHDEVFELMNKRAADYLKNGTNVIYDATNLRRKNRKYLLSVLPKECAKKVYIVWARYETCLERDAHRKHSVGKNIIDRMIKNFQVPYYDEGWNYIGIITTDNILYSRENYDDWTDCAHDNPHHLNTVNEHIQNVIKRALYIDSPYQNEVLLAAKMHDVGKKFTKSFINNRGEKSDIAHFYDHQNVGAYFTLGYNDLSTFRIETILFVVWLVNSHMEPFFCSKYYKSLEGKQKEALDLLHDCDRLGA